MRHKITLLLLSVFILEGCSFVQAGKLLAPQSFGLTPISDRIYVEVGADKAMRANLMEALENAEGAIRRAYGEVHSRPVVNACISEDCYEKFGGGGSTAKVYGNLILLSPRGFSWHFLAHEWSHIELRSRQTTAAWFRMPQWFDEGVAVAVSEAPEHSEAHWQFLIASNVPRPPPEELRTFTSLDQWIAAVHKYGEDKHVARKAGGEPEIRPLYTAAGHELRPWLAQAGVPGLLAFIAKMNAGEDFETAYRTTQTARTANASSEMPPAAVEPKR